MKRLTVLIFTVAFSLQCEALKCYYCRDACKAEQTIQCGSATGNYESVCITEIPKDSKIPGIAIRRCHIATKGKEIECPPTSNCASCKTDLCNAAPVVGANMALMGAITILLLHYM